MLNFKINEELCTQCGQCVADCPPHCIVMEDDPFPRLPDEDKCMRCQHCLAVCPAGALSIMDADPAESLPLAGALPSPQSMRALIQGRRSVRRYKNEALDAETIQRLLETAWSAPTGTNAQSVLFTATTTLEATETFRKKVYQKLDQLLADKPEAEDEPLSMKYMRMAHGAHKEHGIDVALRGAPHVLIASAPKNIAVPKEDCIIALTSFELLAQSMGLGTLWDGILKWAITDYIPELLEELGIPADHQIGYCMLFGKPAVKYHRTVQRTPPPMNLIGSLQN